MNKAYLDDKINKIDGHISFIGKEHNDSKLQYNNKSVEEILTHRAVRTTIQILHDEGLFDSFPNADKVLHDFFYRKT